MDFHVLLYLIDIGARNPLKLWEDGNLQRIAGLSTESRDNVYSLFII